MPVSRGCSTWPGARSLRSCAAVVEAEAQGEAATAAVKAILTELRAFLAPETLRKARGASGTHVRDSFGDVHVLLFGESALQSVVLKFQK